MSNTYFRFKQFTVHQEHCAMKVCTDACIQGAFTAQYLSDNDITVPAILDIGAGTGLLSLMLAQEVAGNITAIELDEEAAKQATANFMASPWDDRLQLIRNDIRKMEKTREYDFIITNPPFYEDALKSGHEGKDRAMHATSLGYSELIAAIDLHLSPQGEVSLLLPYQSFEAFHGLALAAGLHLKQALYIRQSEQHGFFRVVGILSRQPVNTVVTEMAIHDSNRKYTPLFAQLLQPYYLYL